MIVYLYTRDTSKQQVQRYLYCGFDYLVPCEGVPDQQLPVLRCTDHLSVTETTHKFSHRPTIIIIVTKRGEKRSF